MPLGIQQTAPPGTFIPITPIVTTTTTAQSTVTPSSITNIHNSMELLQTKTEELYSSLKSFQANQQSFQHHFTTQIATFQQTIFDSIQRLQTPPPSPPPASLLPLTQLFSNLNSNSTQIPFLHQLEPTSWTEPELSNPSTTLSPSTTRILTTSPVLSTSTASVSISEHDFLKKDRVLKLHPYRPHFMVIKLSHKLSPHCYGPSQIAAKIGLGDYRHHFPSQSKLYPIFHVSLFKEKIGDQIPTLRILPPFKDDGRTTYVPLLILELVIFMKEHIPITKLGCRTQRC